MTTRPHVSGINSITILWRKLLLFHCACFSCMDGMGAYAPGRAFLESFRLCTGSSRAVFRCERAMQNGALYFCGLPCSQIPNLSSFALGFGISRFATSRFFAFAWRLDSYLTQQGPFLCVIDTRLGESISLFVGPFIVAERPWTPFLFLFSCSGKTGSWSTKQKTTRALLGHKSFVRSIFAAGSDFPVWQT